MSLPKFKHKFSHPPVFSALDLVRRNPSLRNYQLPDQAVICFQAHIFSRLSKGRGSRPVPSPFGEIQTAKSGRTTVAVAGNFGIGAPLAVFMLEWLLALGVRRILILGYAGGLHERQGAGDLVLCTKALRDEGTSHHYLPPDDFAEPDPDLTARLGRSLEQLGYAHESGPTWTTDAPFRETSTEINHYRSQGILTVEMEAAALFAAARFHGAACAAAFTVSDAPRNGRWQLDFDRRLLAAGLDRLADAARRTFEAG